VSAAIAITRHGAQRLHERLGLRKRSLWRITQRAFDEGLRPSEAVGALRAHLSALYLSHRTANNLRVYGENVFLFADETLITVFSVPLELRRQSLDQQRQRVGQ
jgi:hypothetical protein